jgi:hypothetical protein
MPALPFYASSDDVLALRDWLNADSSVAFIIREENKRLRAVPRVLGLPDGHHILWEVNSGPLPYYQRLRKWYGERAVVSTVPDPWSGWEETHVGANGVPWFGVGYPGTMSLILRSQSRKTAGAIGVSYFNWDGNAGWSQGRRAAESTTEWWGKLRKWFNRVGIKIPREGAIDGPNRELIAMPGALAEFRRGVGRDNNPGV